MRLYALYDAALSHHPCAQMARRIRAGRHSGAPRSEASMAKAIASGGAADHQDAL